jgi:hypothetical protein
MKVKSISMFLATAAVMIMGFLASPLQASQYLGEITWDVVDDLDHHFTLKGGISKVGGSYYEVQGQADIGNGLIIFSGGGALVGSTYMLSGTATMVETNNKGTFHNANIWRITLDQSFNGSMWMVTTWYNPAQNPLSFGFGNSYDTMQLTKTSGPSNPAATSALPLLLQ